MSRFRGKRVLVTGATGFFGSCFVRAMLEESAVVHVLVRASSDRWRLRDVADTIVPHLVDLTDLETLAAVVDAIAPELVVHAAATHGHPSTRAERLRHVSESVVGTVNLLDCLRGRSDCRTLHIGSSTEYGAQAAALHEAMAPQPSSYRGATKAAAAMFALEASRAQSCTVIRPFSIYGPWESRERFMPTMIKRALAGEPLELTRPGVHHDFVYVDDVVEGCKRALLTPLPPATILNLGSGVQTANEHVADLVKRLTQSSSPIALGAHPGHAPDTNHWVADMTQTERLLGWRPRVDLETGLTRFIAWMKLHGAALGY